jgi:probable O-glycosylation ligase (exosortase A-associated)
MRDLAIIGFVFAMIPFMIKRPWIGVMMWAWISLMNPHAWGWGLANQFRVALVAGVATLIGLLVTRERVKLPFNSTIVLLVLLPLWMTFTLLFAFRFEAALGRWEDVMKMYLFVLVTASVLHTRKHIDILLWVIVLSVGFYGVKGGIFTILTGGQFRVWGPPGKSFITDNNSISVALIMIIPLAHYLAMHTERRVVKYGLYALIGLSCFAILGTHSRGAFLAVMVMAGFLWLKSRQKLLLGLFVAGLLPFAISFMPENWVQRMETVKTYEEDTSAMGRINSWQTAINITKDRPIVGGGFEFYSKEVFARYAPNPEAVHSAHSIYFQMLGEHGYVGLLLFLAVGINGWMLSRRLIAHASGKPEISWAADLARAIQVSLVGFASGGAFVNIGYWELQYYEVVLLMIAWSLVRSTAPETSTTAAPGVASPGGVRA